jgi:arabinose-5-phosphate isomerase
MVKYFFKKWSFACMRESKKSTQPHDFIRLGKAVIQTERDAISALLNRLDEKFNQACQYLLACSGRTIVMGMGKSGHIGKKIASTLASTGTPAFFIHPAEASHGDLGMITARDVMIIISNSGNTEEIISILPLIKRLGIPLITLTGNPDSALAKAANVNLDVSIQKEACPLNLAPTASTTTALVMGDALAIALLNAKGFTENDFALSHPGGRLGKRLLLRIEDIMHTGDAVPRVHENDLLRAALFEMSQKGLGMTAVLNAKERLVGIFTDGDLRRALDKEFDVHTTLISQVMTTTCTTVKPDLLVAEALQLMEKRKINGLLVLDEEKHLVGAFNLLDILRSGVM